MWRKIRPLFTGIGITVFFLIMIAIVASLWFKSETLSPLSERMILTFKLDTPLSETRQFDFSKRKEAPSIHDISFTLHQAALDERVKAVYVRLQQQNFSISDVQELKGAFESLRTHGKILKIYSENYAGLGPNISTYYLASFFNEIWLQPTGMVDASPLEISIPFIRETLNTIGVTPEITRAGAYKSAPETFTNKEISPENKTMMQRLLQHLNAQIKDDILNNQKIKNWENVVAQSPLTDKQALEMGLISRLGYFDEFNTDIEMQKKYLQSEVIDLLNYNERHQNENLISTRKKVAFVLLNGVIPEPGTSAQHTALGQEGEISPHKIEEAFFDIIQNQEIDTILLRINSPGGSPSGSETIRRALVHAQKAGKKIYISIGNVAASGGYWIIANGDQIYANPSSLTGSIGVYGGKMSFEELWKKLGVHWETITEDETSKHFWSPHFNYSDTAKKILENRIQTTYKDFITRVSEGRNLPPQKVESIAQGQVWSGQEAIENGLIDKIGSLYDVVQDIKEEQGLKPKDTIELIPFPQPLSPFEELLNTLGQFISVQIGVSDILESVHAIKTQHSEFKTQMQPISLQ